MKFRIDISSYLIVEADDGERALQEVDSKSATEDIILNMEVTDVSPELDEEPDTT